MEKILALLKKIRNCLLNKGEDSESVKVKDRIRSKHFDMDMNFGITDRPKEMR